MVPSCEAYVVSGWCVSPALTGISKSSWQAGARRRQYDVSAARTRNPITEAYVCDLYHWMYPLILFFHRPPPPLLCIPTHHGHTTSDDLHNCIFDRNYTINKATLSSKQDYT